MKLRLVGWLRRLLVWLEGHPEYLVRAIALVHDAEQLHPEAGGEFKRHQVYARLIKDFPAIEKRVLSRAIEDALR